ncbi:hypothetical protein [Streptomyces mirabilis]|uniref:Uncharacterized protein n=1 Tax=Streptomyces mirabilis TaxID=68239 RepID=A0ABU3UXU5_9ACTN|nr:hypothetical protein [Streptomyces mirabilis]MDU8998732.1 hypothetical protein [Streptomyces mirabilis]
MIDFMPYATTLFSQQVHQEKTLRGRPSVIYTGKGVDCGRKRPASTTGVVLISTQNGHVDISLIIEFHLLSRTNLVLAALA